ncbi:transmembrane protein, putative [Medicago truncatula]|uniref:Transmembrane protein, putative n=1 Tax=Medicago truncatula TaxID=3880 RepID=A0A072U012_MEDTR|nr:transmembrane protein, putative [Medicago truncatula]
MDYNNLISVMLAAIVMTSIYFGYGGASSAHPPDQFQQPPRHRKAKTTDITSSLRCIFFSSILGASFVNLDIN